MRKGYTKSGQPIDLATAFEAVGKFETKEISEEELKDIECNACPSGGSCSGMFTANSMNTLCEAMGIALSGNGTILALTKEREELIRRAGRRICDDLATWQAVKHPTVSHRDAVIHADSVKFKRHAAVFADLVF